MAHHPHGLYHLLVSVWKPSQAVTDTIRDLIRFDAI
jgi:hypothetical protein